MGGALAGAVIAEAEPDDAGAIAVLHARLFEPAWDAAAINALMAPPPGFALMALLPAGRSGGRSPAGFLLARAAAGEAEILSIGVTAEAQRQGLARRLLEVALQELRERGALRLFLEVAADNEPAIGLYRSAGFTEVGRRRAYYTRRIGPAVDALVLARDL